MPIRDGGRKQASRNSKKESKATHRRFVHKQCCSLLLWLNILFWDLWLAINTDWDHASWGCYVLTALVTLFMQDNTSAKWEYSNLFRSSRESIFTATLVRWERTVKTRERRRAQGRPRERKERASNAPRNHSEWFKGENKNEFVTTSYAGALKCSCSTLFSFRGPQTQTNHACASG